MSVSAVASTASQTTQTTQATVTGTPAATVKIGGGASPTPTAATTQSTATISVAALEQQLAALQREIQQISANNALSAQERATETAQLTAQATTIQVEIAQAQLSSSLG